MRAIRISQVLAVALLLAGIAGIAANVAGSPISLTAFTLTEASTTMTLGLYVDLLSAVLLTFIASIAALVATYSMRNLRGQVRLHRFGWLLTASFVTLALLVTSASLPMLAAAWTAAGLLLAALVAHRPTSAARHGAAAVRRTMLIGDVLLWAGVVAAFVALPSVDRADLADSVGSSSTALTVAAAALAAAAVIRSALVPATGWLPLTGEAPSPVSAFLHAGVVNGAAVLVALWWPMFAASPAVLGGLIVVGTLTAATATVVGKLRPDVKGSLASSTSAQMGYMTIQLGLGLPAAAVLHLIGHGSFKAWQFLRAGGAITRSRTEPAPGSAPVLSRAEWLLGGVLACLAVLGVLALLVPRLIDTLGLLGPATALPIAAAAGTTAVAITALWRRLTPTRLAATALTTVAALGSLAAYLIVLTWWDGVFATALPETPVWSAAAAVAWLVAILAAGAGLLWAVRHVKRNPDGRLAMIALSDLIPRGARVSAAPARRTDAMLGSTPVEPAMAAELAAAAGQVVAPAFPLRAAVAANPLARLEDLPFLQAARVAERTWGARLFLPEATYLDLWERGEVSNDAIDRVLVDYVADLPGADLAAARAELLTMGRAALARPVPADESLLVPLLAERSAVPVSGHQWSRAAVAHLYDGLFTARVWAQPSPPADGELLRRWREAVANGWGARIGLADLADDLPEAPDAALAALLQRSQLPGSEWFEYLCRLLTSAPGWASHAAWREREGFSSALVELLVVRLAHDLALGGPAELSAEATSADPEPVVALADGQTRRRVWQASAEEHFRSQLVGSMADAARQRTPRSPRRSAADAQIVTCIDVRSERLRRAIERVGRYETFGFAGFFGAALRYHTEFGHALDQCPVLLTPSNSVSAQSHVSDTAVYAGRRAVDAAWTTPVAPFALTEATGLAAGVMAALHTIAPATTTKWGHAGAPAQWHSMPDLAGIERTDAPTPDGSAAPGIPVGYAIDELVDLAYGALHAIGLHRDLAPLLVFAGHAATVQNNAFAAAYDCGACGGNGGLVNARILAYALNSPQVRRSLALRGIVVPADTVAVAALHDTTTDELILDRPAAPSRATRHLLDQLTADAAVAGRVVNAERVADLPGATSGDPTRAVRRRAGDWAEPCPEWGLAGNAAFVIGPRDLTAGLDLGGRVFLHSYEPDQDHEAAVLGAILNAPVIVAQWISSQYYCSTVDAAAFGSGDKSTHNVVGDVGVITGAFGDLKVGLPWQSLFTDEAAAERGLGRHVPLRLSVVAYADPEAVARIVRSSPKLRDLVAGEWISITAINPATGIDSRLTPALGWRSDSARTTQPAAVAQDPAPRTQHGDASQETPVA